METKFEESPRMNPNFQDREVKEVISYLANKVAELHHENFELKLALRKQMK